MKNKFYEKKWFVWLSLIVFAPVGIALLWRNKIYSQRANIAITVFFGFVFLMAITSKPTQEPTVATQPVTSTVTVTQPVTPKPTQTEKEKYNAWVKSQFSIWDGSHTELIELLKENLNDAKSFEHVKTTYSDSGKGLVVRMRYRAKNAFGGMVMQSITAKADYANNRIQIIDVEN